ncbi:MAG: hypothetical protein LBK75_11720 [Oscillospiraceae bacterium]|jgi:hypothetical protein|nr:hypothetical protein [Oscillospiraceae bacterium]
MLRYCASILLLVMILSSCSRRDTADTDYNYSLGRNPFSSFVNALGDEVLFKSFVLSDNDENELIEYLYQGLFSKIQGGASPKLIYPDFSHGLNVHSNKLYFIDTKYHLLRYDISTKIAETLPGIDDKTVAECLIIDNILFYITEDTTENTYTLNACDLIQNDHNIIADNVHWERLNQFQGNIQFFDRNGNPQIYDFIAQTIVEYGPFDMEVLQIMDDERVIGYKDYTMIQCDLDGKNEKILFSAQNIYNVILTQNEIFYSTVAQETYTQTFCFSFSTSKTRELATTNFPIVGYADTYLFCASSAGSGDLQRIDVNSGEVVVFDDRAKDYQSAGFLDDTAY